MKIEGRLFLAGIAFYTLSAIVYGLWAREPAGTTALALTAGLALLIGFYVTFTGSRIGERPEDRVDGEIEEASGEYGFFSPHSWWPLPTAAGASITGLGLIFGWWLVFLGILVLGYAVLGMVFEYYRGEHAH